MTEQIPEENAGQPKKFRYKGSSMLPTFKPGQMLYIHPEMKTPQPGDVIVYRKAEEYVVHRVNAVENGNFHTRGDNNRWEDLLPVSPKEVIGVVERVDDWGINHNVPGGKTALIRARSKWGFMRFFNHIKPWLGAPYRWLKARRWVEKVWHPQVTIVRVNTPYGSMIKYVVRGGTVATWQPELRKFVCRRLYDLVIFPPE